MSTPTKIAAIGSMTAAIKAQRALAAADLVTVSNNDHALARIIYDIESGKIAL